MWQPWTSSSSRRPQQTGSLSSAMTAPRRVAMRRSVASSRSGSPRLLGACRWCMPWAVRWSHCVRRFRGASAISPTRSGRWSASRRSAFSSPPSVLTACAMRQVRQAGSCMAWWISPRRRSPCQVACLAASRQQCPPAICPPFERDRQARSVVEGLRGFSAPLAHPPGGLRASREHSVEASSTTFVSSGRMSGADAGGVLPVLRSLAPSRSSRPSVPRTRCRSELWGASKMRDGRRPASGSGRARNLRIPATCRLRSCCSLKPGPDRQTCSSSVSGTHRSHLRARWLCPFEGSMP